MRSTPGRRREADPMDLIPKDPTMHRIPNVSTRTGDKFEYKGFASQRDYFAALGYEEIEVPKGALRNPTDVVMQIPLEQKRAWDAEGRVESLAMLNADTTVTEDISGGNPEISMTNNTMSVQQISRSKRGTRKSPPKPRGRPPKKQEWTTVDEGGIT